MRPDERLERVEFLLSELREKNRDVPIIVEGRRDVESLRALGIEGTVVLLNTGKGVFRTCEEIARDPGEAIILTDWDRRGGQLCRRLRDGLEANDAIYDTDFRARIASLSKKEVTDVEGLAGFVRRLRRHPRNRRRVSQGDTYL